MTRSGLVLLAAATGLLVTMSRGVGSDPTPPGPEEPQHFRTHQNELLRISGTFAVVSFESQGEQLPQAALKQMKVIQKGADWSFEIGGSITRGRDTIVVGGPVAQIDCVYIDGPLNGQKVLGIVKVKGDRITYCWAEQGQARPTTFATSPGSGLTLFVLERVPPAKGP